MALQDGIRVVGAHDGRFDEVLTPKGLTFLSQLHDTFDERRRDLLAERDERRRRIAAGEDPDFLAETKHIREDPDWVSLPQRQGWTSSPKLRSERTTRASAPSVPTSVT